MEKKDGGEVPYIHFMEKKYNFDEKSLEFYR